MPYAITLPRLTITADTPAEAAALAVALRELQVAAKPRKARECRRCHHLGHDSRTCSAPRAPGPKTKAQQNAEKSIWMKAVWARRRAAKAAGGVR